MLQTDWKSLEKRLGHTHLERRRRIETDCEKTHFTFGYWELRLHHIERMLKVLKWGLRGLGLWNTGVANTLKYRLNIHRPRLQGLPSAFCGYKILHLSDLHIDAIHDQGRSLRQRIETLDTDLCVLTGDFRYHVYGNSEVPMTAMKRLLEGLRYRDGIFAVLGNHDTADMVPQFESFGVRVLLNESVEISHDGESIRLCGVDDPHYFRLHDLRKTLTGVDNAAFKILLAHSPDIANAAEREGFDFYLCGHSHGGQICLPGGLPIVANLRCKRKFFKGAWQHGPMRGYTSSGSGAAGVPVRFFSNPEITVHELRPAALK